MNLTDRPNLKPIRDYDEHDVINFIAPTGVLNKGTFVTLSATNSGNTNLVTGGNAPNTPYQTVSTAFGGAPAYAYSKRGNVQWTYKEAAAGDPVLGVMLYDCKDTNRFGESYRYRPTHERNEHQVTLPGESSPVLLRGLISTNNFSGTPLAGSGAFYSGGRLRVQVYSKSTSIGQFISSADAQGYALFYVSCL